jgi:hypothetical protein
MQEKHQGPDLGMTPEFVDKGRRRNNDGHKKMFHTLRILRRAS